MPLSKAAKVTFLAAALQPLLLSAAATKGDLDFVVEMRLVPPEADSSVGPPW